MRFTCEKYLLTAAVAKTSRAAAVRSPVSALEGLLIETSDESVRISGFDLKTGIVTDVPADVREDGEIVLNARLFGEIIRKIPGDEVDIHVSRGNIAAISSQMSDFEILGSPASDYPELPVVDGEVCIEIGEMTLKQMISQTSFAISDNETRPIQTGALFEVSKGELRIVAVDGFRLALCCEPLEKYSRELSFVVPGAALNEVEKLLSDGGRTVSVSLGEKHIVFSIGDTVLVTRRLEGEFLNYRSVIPETSKYTVNAVKNDLISAVERVSLILSDKIKSPLRCIFGESVIKLHTASALGKASDECYMSGNGEDIEIGFNDKYLHDALKAAPSEEITIALTSGVLPCVISTSGDDKKFLCMILPVRLKAD
jgi:DNA polymerase-3 subunit beta